MIEARKDAGFLQVCLEILRARDSLWPWDFDRNRAVEIFVVGQEDLTEATLPDPPENRVSPNLRGMEWGVRVR